MSPKVVKIDLTPDDHLENTMSWLRQWPEQDPELGQPTIEIEEILSRVRDGTTNVDDAHRLEKYLTSDHLIPQVRNKLAYEKHINKNGNSGIHVHLDFNDFSLVNKLYSHAVGDSVIKGGGNTVAKVGKQYGARVFRTGGDEFCLWFFRPIDAENFAKDLSKEFKELYHNLPNYNISASIGLGHNPERAEAALKQAKAKLKTITPDGTVFRHAELGKAPTVAVTLLNHPTPDGWKSAEASIQERKHESPAT